MIYSPILQRSRGAGRVDVRTGESTGAHAMKIRLQARLGTGSPWLEHAVIYGVLRVLFAAAAAAASIRLAR